MMKKIKSSRTLHNACRLSFWLKILLIIMTFNGIAQGKSEFGELISLNTNNQPLVEVLENVSQASGYQFIIDANWEDLPITVRFDAIPLDQALKRILVNMNHAIVYNSDRKVWIRIYDNDSSAFGHTEASIINRYPSEPSIQLQEIEMSTSPNPVPPEPITEEVESDDSQTDGTQPDESELSFRKPETSDAESEDKENNESSDEGSQAQDNN